MGVYLPNMKMPTSCYQCSFLFHPERHGKVYCTAVEPMMDISETLSDERASDCPLVPVPPHGRLIDADALAVHKFAGAENDISIADGGACYRRGWNDAIEAIMENAETITGEE